MNDEFKWCGTCGKTNKASTNILNTGCKELRAELGIQTSMLAFKCWRPMGTVFIWDHHEEEQGQTYRACKFSGL